MNVLITKEKDINIYPSLRKTKDGLIVLFSEEQSGITINFSKEHEIGEFRTDWIMDRFVMFNGKAELSND